MNMRARTVKCDWGPYRLPRSDEPPLPQGILITEGEMKLRPRDSKPDDPTEVIGRIEVDPERGPWVRLLDGQEIGPLDTVMVRFVAVDLSDEEIDAIRQIHDMRHLAEHARHLERQAADGEHEILRLRGEGEGFLEHASKAGFRLPEVPNLPGVVWNPFIKAERWNWFDTERRSQILKGMLTVIDWKQKMREWNFDAVAINVLGRDGQVLARVALREGYQGPIA
jgi:hypothetical protein